MSYIDFCLIADHNADRRDGLKKKISNNKMSSTVVGALNCGHGLLYLNQCLDKVVGKQVVVILNPKTPMMGGLEFLVELKKADIQHSAERIKIVLVEEGLSTEDKKEYKKHGVVDFVDYTLEEEALEEQLKNIFKKPRAKRASVETESKSTKMKKIVNTSKDSFHDLESNQVYMVPISQVG